MMKHRFARGLLALGVALAAPALACDRNENCTREQSYPCPTFTNPGRKCTKSFQDPLCEARKRACVSVPLPRLPDIRQWLSYSNNRSERQQELRRKYEAIVFLKFFNYEEYSKFAHYLAAAVATENPGPVITYLKQLLAEMKRKAVSEGRRELEALARKLSHEMLMKALDSAVHGRPFRTGIDRARFDIGLVTYDNWKKVSLDIPYLSGREIKWRHQSRTEGLPHTFEVYVGLDIR